MTLTEISNLTLDQAFFEILPRLGIDFSLVPSGQTQYSLHPNDTLSMYDRIILNAIFVKPTLAAMDIELVFYKAELTTAENARLAEVARLDDLKARFQTIHDRDAGMPAYYQIIFNQPNYSIYFKNMVFGESDHVLAESRMKAIEDKDIVLQAALSSTAYVGLRLAEYPSTDELIVAMWEGNQIVIDEIETLRQAIKTKYPKP